jgi:four helix bundle protein
MESGGKIRDLEDRLVEFAILIMKISEKLPTTQSGRYISDQLIRSGTSPALNYGEAKGAESSGDFIHKMKICLKELRETFIAAR